MCHNPQTREWWSLARQSAAQLGVTEAAFWPSVSSQIGQSRVHSAERYQTQQTASLTLSWLAFDFGGRDAAREQAQHLLWAAFANQDSGLQTLFLTTLQAYYTAQASDAAVLAAEQSERAAKTSLDAAEQRYRVGTGTPLDRLQAQTALSQARLSRLRAEGEARVAQGSLASLLGRSPARRIEIESPSVTGPDKAFAAGVEQLMADAQAKRPDLRAAEAKLAAASANVVQVGAQGKPTVTFSAGPHWQAVNGSDNPGGTLAFTVNLPVFTGFAHTYQKRLAEAQRDQQQAVRDRLVDQVALDVWKAYQRLQTATQTLSTTDDLLRSAEQAERVALGRYQAGVGTVIDVLTAQSALANARLQRIQAHLDWFVSRATLAQAMGILGNGYWPGKVENIQ